ncbi:MAG: transposase [Bacillota bacterium]
MSPDQMELFDRVGVVQWQEDGVRYVGCFSEFRKERAERRRLEAMKEVKEIERLSTTARKGRYYSWVGRMEKVNGILSEGEVADLWKVKISALEPLDSPEKKALLNLSAEVDEEAVALRESLEGKYLLQTSLSPEECSAEQVREAYMQLQLAERGFRNIKSYLKIRPIYHYKRRRVRAHVLICFLAYYLEKKIELELRKKGEPREVAPLLRDWDKLRLVQIRLEAGEHSRTEWQWWLGDIGKGIKSQLEDIGWWNSLDAYRRSLCKS